MPQNEFPVILPTCYDKFQCKGGACRNNCCQGWSIDISRAEYNKIRHLVKPETAKNIFQRAPRKQATDNKYAAIQLNELGICPFLNDEHLCDLQIEHGYQSLPRICKVFPRLLMEISHSKEYSLVLDTGCEHTLELLWEESETGIQFTQRKQDISKLAGTVLAEHPLKEYASDIRNLCIWLLQNRAYSLADRMILLGLAIRELQEIQDANTLDQIPIWFVKYQAYSKNNELKNELENLQGNRQLFILNNLKLLLSYQLLSPSKLLTELFETVKENIDVSMDSIAKMDSNHLITIDNVSFSPELYNHLASSFSERFPKIDNFLENILVLIFFRDTFPLKRTSPWENLNEICSIYSLMLFLATATEPKNASELIDTLVVISRRTNNFQNFPILSFKELANTESNSLAHMAILLRG